VKNKKNYHTVGTVPKTKIAGTYEQTITNIDGNSFLTRGCRMIDKGDDIIINCTSIGLMFIPTLPSKLSYKTPNTQ
jgi:hypothetical protein